jgi:hypothetical protein
MFVPRGKLPRDVNSTVVPTASPTDRATGQPGGRGPARIPIRAFATLLLTHVAIAPPID